MYCREDGTPYYIGKGRGNRIHSTHRKVGLPPVERRKFLKTNLTEEESFKHERYMISILGRKDIGTGILRNLTDGGEGPSGNVQSEETIQKRVQSRKGYKPPEELKQRISKTLMGHTQSDETRQKISNTLKGRKLPQETIDKIIKTRTTGKFRKKVKEKTWNGIPLSKLTPEQKEERKWEQHDKRVLSNCNKKRLGKRS